MSKVPTEKLYVSSADAAVGEILEFARHLEAKGERPWFEVYYPAPSWMNEEEALAWTQRQESLGGEGTFDAVEVIDGDTIRTLPPYAVLMSEEAE